MCFRWVVKNVVKPVKMYLLDEEAGDKMQIIIVLQQCVSCNISKHRNISRTVNPLGRRLASVPAWRE